MAQDFLLPDPGEGIHEAEIVEVHVSAGDDVKDGDPLFSVETDKAVVDIPASFDGQIEDVRVEVGETVEVGSVLLTYTAVGGSAESAEPESGDAKGSEDVGSDQAPADPTEPGGDDGTGSQGTEFDESDSRRAVETEGRPKLPPVPASPATRSLAKNLDVDLHEVEGSGPDGRIEPQDVQAAAGEVDKEADEASKKLEPGAAEDVQWVELRGVRKASARQMERSWQEIPHVTHHDMADITDLEELRRDQSEEIEEQGGSLSLTVFLMKAAAAALAEHPRFNATIDMEKERIGFERRVNIGIAVDTEDGLVVPVVEDVPDKSIAELADELPGLVDRMREGERSLDDMAGGTFTITNPGAIGGTSFNPIINHPEVAILGAAQARHTPVLSDDGEWKPRLQLPLVLAFDHRVNDGADAARFVNTIKSLLEDPAELMLHL